MLKSIGKFFAEAFCDPTPIIGAYVEDYYWIYYGRGYM